MQTSRRTLLIGLAAAALPLRAWSLTTLTLGDATLDTLSDGHLVLPGAFLFGAMDPATAAPILARHHIDPEAQIEPPCNLTLLRDGTNTVLFDAGSGPSFMPTAGKVVDALDALGLAPEDVTHVVFTHGHPDHLWGVLDDFDEPLFANARHLMGRVERDYWSAPETLDSIGEARAIFAAGAQRRLEALGDRIEVFGDGETVAPGVVALATHGHTPGHTSFLVSVGEETAMVVGDAIGNAHVAFEAPELPTGSDQDMAMAAATRRALLDQLATDEIPLIGFHLPDGGLGLAERQGDAFRFVPL